MSEEEESKRSGLDSRNSYQQKQDRSQDGYYDSKFEEGLSEEILKEAEKNNEVSYPKPAQPELQAHGSNDQSEQNIFGGKPFNNNSLNPNANQGFLPAPIRTVSNDSSSPFYPKSPAGIDYYRQPPLPPIYHTNSSQNSVAGGVQSKRHFYYTLENEIELDP
jgi:hypothetical protein